MKEREAETLKKRYIKEKETDRMCIKDISRRGKKQEVLITLRTKKTD